MKKLVFILFFFSISLFLRASETVPEKLIEAIDSLKKDPHLYPVHRIDLIIIKNQNITASDTEEIFLDLQEFIFSTDLINLSNKPSFLVEKESISKGLSSNDQVIKTVDVNKNKVLIENLEKQDNSAPKDPQKKQLKLSYPYFEKINTKESSIIDLVKKLKEKKEYEVLYTGSWYQPVFNKKLASPVYIKSNKKKDGVRGELTIYKERFLHCLVKIRLIEKIEEYSKVSKLSAYDFNVLLNISKVDRNLTSFFSYISKEVSSFSKWLFRTKDFSKTSELNQEVSELSETYIDRYEINETLKMKESEYYFIDHPYFGIILKVSLWKHK